MYLEQKAEGEVLELDAASLLLLRAADLIEERGHYNGRDRLVGICAGLALLAVSAKSNPHLLEAMTRLSRHLGGEGYDGVRVFNWNDAHTQAEVVSTMRAVALSR